MVKYDNILVCIKGSQRADEKELDIQFLLKEIRCRDKRIEGLKDMMLSACVDREVEDKLLAKFEVA